MHKEFRPELPPGIILEKDVYVPMRDGVKVAVDIYRPAKEGKYPSLFSTSVYFKAAQAWNPALSRSIEAGAIYYFVLRGYAYVVAQARGSGPSQGQYNWYDPTEQRDGFDVIEWIARQPWCTGNVGMVGDSYFGRMQWLLAALQPPHLKCIAPLNASMDDYRSRHEGGIIWLNWLSIWSADVICQTTQPVEVEGRMPPTNLLAQVCANPDDGPFYWERSGYKKADKFRIPILSVAFATNPLHAKSQLSGYSSIKTTKKLVILPPCQANVMCINSRPFNEYLLKWFDHWLKGKVTGIMNEPEIAICDSATGEWRYEEAYPLARTKWTKYYLHSNTSNSATKPPYGLISKELPGSEVPDSWDTPEVMRTLAARKPVAAFSTPPLEEDVRVWGPLSLNLHASSTTLDTVWFVKLGYIKEDGQISLLTAGHLKASYRETDPSKSLPGQPFHPYQNPVPPEPNKVYEYQIEISPIFHTFKKGHKIWIQIASDDPDHMGFLNTVYNAQEMLPIPAKHNIYHDSVYPSYLLLPEIPDTPIIKPVEAPLSKVKWPLAQEDKWPLL